MPSGSVRRVSRQDIQLVRVISWALSALIYLFFLSHFITIWMVLWIQVQNLIERCLQLYMNQKEVVDTLLDQAKIEPDFTSLGNYLGPFWLCDCKLFICPVITFPIFIIFGIIIYGKNLFTSLPTMFVPLSSQWWNEIEWLFSARIFVGSVPLHRVFTWGMDMSLFSLVFVKLPMLYLYIVGS